MPRAPVAEQKHINTHLDIILIITLNNLFCSFIVKAWIEAHFVRSALVTKPVTSHEWGKEIIIISNHLIYFCVRC